MEAGTTIGPYELVDTHKIGDGAGCVGVYKAVDTRSGQLVAIKTVDRVREVDATWRHSFQRELDIAIKLQHPNVIELLDVVFWDRYVCLVMEHAGGGELFQVIATHGAMVEDTARVYFRQIVSAVIHCHSNGICHRDLKLENCLLAEPGSTCVKITDFGLSKDVEQHSQPRTKKVGTISYMAPEVSLATGDVPYNGEAADVWSLGVILYVLVCCDYPFGFDGAGGQPTHQVLQRIKDGAFRFPTDKVALSPEIMSLISGILTVDLSKRTTLAGIIAHPWCTAGQEFIVDTGGVARRTIDWDRAPHMQTQMSVESVEFEFEDSDED